MARNRHASPAGEDEHAGRGPRPRTGATFDESRGTARAASPDEHDPEVGSVVRPRAELPVRVADTAPLPAAYDAELEHGLAALGLTLGPGARAVIDGHARLLLAWTGAINLTAIREPTAVARRHVLDSLAGLSSVSAGGSPGRMLDLGSGGGYPGIVLAALLPETAVVLVDSVAKKVRFLDMVIAATGLGPRVEAIAARAELLARDRNHRAAYDVVVARAVGSLADLVELAVPLLRVGGRLVVWKRDGPAAALAGELEAARHTADVLGADRPQVEPVAIDALPGHVLVVVAKRASTAPAYPRDPALRLRRPL